MDNNENFEFNFDDKIENIIPPAKPSIASCNLCETFLNKKPIIEPITVAPPTAKAVSKTISILSFV